MATPAEMLSVQEVARRLDVSPRTVKRWIRRGHLRGYKLPLFWKVASFDLERFLRTRRTIVRNEQPTL